MQRLATFLGVMLVLGTPSVASALSGRAQVVCENGQHVVSVSGDYQPDYDGVYEGIVFRREAIGICAAEEFLPPNPLPFVPQADGTFAATVALDAPSPDGTYRYTPYGVRPDGSFEKMFYQCDSDFRSYAVSSCAGTPFVRGRLELLVGCNTFCVEIIPCSEDCWTEPLLVDLSALVSVMADPLGEMIGQVVDVFGDRTLCRMTGGATYSITRIELSPTGICGPVPVQETNWGSLKAAYH